MDAEIARLNKLAQEKTRIGGKGSMRRKTQVVHNKNAASVDDKKIISKLNFKTNVVQQIEEANLFKADGNIVHFKNPRVNAAAGVFIVSGQNQTIPMASMPQVISQLGAENINHIKRMAEAFSKASNANVGSDDIPDLVEGNFSEVADKQ